MYKPRKSAYRPSKLLTPPLYYARWNHFYKLYCQDQAWRDAFCFWNREAYKADIGVSIVAQVSARIHDNAGTDRAY
jgi:hypothetical protein